MTILNGSDNNKPEDHQGRSENLEVFTIPGIFLGVLFTFATAAASALTTNIWVWLVLGIFTISVLGAFLFIVTGVTRIALAAHLRDSRFTQVYRWLIGLTFGQIWKRLAPDLPEDAGFFLTLRAAAVPRVFDSALGLALLYPFLLPASAWIWTGAATGLSGPGGVSFAAAPFWPGRAATLGGIALVLLGWISGRIAATSSRGSVRRIASWLPLVGVLGGGLLAVAGAGAGVVAGAGAVAVAGAVAAAGAGAIAVAAAVAVAVAGAGAGAIAVAGAVAVAFAVAVAGAVAVAVAVAVGVARLDKTGRGGAARALLTMVLLALAAIAAAIVGPRNSHIDIVTLIIFVGVLPIVNGVFDFLSYAVTLALVRIGLFRGRSAFGLGLIDVIVAAGLFLGLGFAMIATVALLNRLAGVPLVDLLGLLNAIKHHPGAHWWITAMLFSTLLPTGLHAMLAVFSLQGMWPRRLRDSIADRVERSGRDPVAATVAPLQVGALWTATAVVVGGLLWAGWTAIPLTATDIGHWYLDRLWIFAFDLGAL